jgi:hypothetical protein
MRERLAGRPLALPLLGEADAALWSALLDLAAADAEEWTLVGGQMVHLHGVRLGVQAPRVSTDLDTLVNARVVGATRRFTKRLLNMRFQPDGVSPDNLAHRFRRDTVSIDVLAPEGLGPRTDLTTMPPGRTLQVPGGTQALNRTQLVPAALDGRVGYIPLPSLLGAIVAKACAVAVDDVPEAQRRDLAFLLTLVDDPFALQREMKPKDRQRLQRRVELRDPRHPAWRDLARAADGLAALEILTSAPARA